MNLKKLHEAKLAKVQENLKSSQLDEATSKIVIGIAETLLNESVEDAEKEIKETEDKLKETEDKLKETEDKLTETEEKLKETEEKLDESEKSKEFKLTENVKNAIDALVKIETKQHVATLKEMKAYDKNREAIATLTESSIKLLSLLGHDIMTDGNKAIVASANKRANIAESKYNDLVANTNKTLKESNKKITKMATEQAKLESRHKRQLAESLVAVKSEGLSLIQKESLKTLIESKNFDNMDEFKTFLDESVQSLTDPETKEPLVIGRINENQLEQPSNSKTTIEDNTISISGNIFV